MERAPSPPEMPFFQSLTLGSKRTRSGDDWETALRNGYRRLAEEMNGRLEVGTGAVGFCSMDGLTIYWDAYGEDMVASSFHGLDYGHAYFVELRAETEAGLACLRAHVEAVFGSEFELEEGENRIRQRGWS